MKRPFIITGLLLFSLIAHAGEFTNFSSILFQNASTWVPANNVCKENQNLYHKNRDYIEKVRCFGADQDNCEVWERIPLVQKIKSMRVRCSLNSNNECRAYESVRFDQPNVLVEIFNSKRSFEDSEKPVDSFWYRIPECN